MNKVILTGRLTRDPSIHRSQEEGRSEKVLANFTLAVRRKGYRTTEGQNYQNADFFNCVAFDRYAEFANNYFRQGMKIEVIGRLQNRSYVNKDGNKVYVTEVIIEEQEFAESKHKTEPSSASNETEEGFMNIPPDEMEEGLPFA